MRDVFGSEESKSKFPEGLGERGDDVVGSDAVFTQFFGSDVAGKSV